MNYIVDNNVIKIPTNKKPIGKGSEGIVFRIDNYAYKIYYEHALDEGYGKKENYHIYLMNLPTKQIILPDKSIYKLDGTYQGYRTVYIDEYNTKNTGITKINSQKLLKNLQILEDDISILSNNYVLMADVTPVNYIFDQKNETMNIIDPGRYKCHSLKTDDPDYYLKLNQKQLNNLIELLLYLDFIEYKPIKTKRKQQLLRDYIIEQKRKEEYPTYKEFFEDKIKDYENLDDYAKTLEKYIR